MISNPKVVFSAVISCLLFVLGEALPPHSPSFHFKESLIQNLTSSYASFLDDVYNYLTVSNVTEECRLHMKEIQNLANFGDPNALKIFDASGKPSSGILEGSVHFIGYYSECVNTIVKVEKNFLRGQYCLLNLNVSGYEQRILPNPSWEVMKKATKPPTIGICIPLSCSVNDIKFATDASLSNNFGDIQGTIEVCHTHTKGFSKDISAIFFMSFQIFVIAVVSLATVYDYYLNWRKRKVIETLAAKSVSTELLFDQRPDPNEPSSTMQYLLAFSLYTNTPKIFSVKERDNIACLHGLRFLSMALIIFGHSFSFAGSVLYVRNPGMASDAPKDFVNQIFANGTFAVDTFFFMSGLLVCYAGIKTLETAKKKWSWMLVFYVHRYVRLAPLMMAVVFNCAFLLRYFSSGPNWLNSIVMYDAWCRKQWWVNALFIQDFYNTNEMCLSHTWYLAADMQMYLVSPLILIPLVWNLKAGIAAMIAFLLATTIATGVITAQNHYPAIPYINNVVPLDLVNEYYKNVYIKPYCRMGPFIVGMAIGYFMYKKKECVLNKSLVVVCWLLSIGSGLTIIYLMWPANQGILPTNAEAAAYSALARTAWGVCLAWLVFACYYGYGGIVNTILSWSLWVPVSRLTFPAYLIHPVIISAVYGSIESPREFSLDFMLYMFIGHMFLTYVLSLVLSLLYESPFVVMEKILLRPKKKPKEEDACVNHNYRQ
ncbi:nose resistant to fluoxetine protein 6-like [Parasteatoda tepidariorum]|uniref:nose resistant to fluoxetine protein 6-like n=1 Tax=Parasteatoda tepidariorum TaxID=114398 RepID=UPI001C727C43|nr:nose resistant to fluoxetine protein 6-like [Parasteatoda tepidariorum]